MSSTDVRAGSLNRRITLQTRSSTQDSFGQQSTTWTDAFGAWSNIVPLAGRELQAAQAIKAETTHEITLRYRASITPAMRVVYQGRVFNVLSALDEDTAHRTLTLLCSEGLTQG